MTLEMLAPSHVGSGHACLLQAVGSHHELDYGCHAGILVRSSDNNKEMDSSEETDEGWVFGG